MRVYFDCGLANGRLLVGEARANVRENIIVDHARCEMLHVCVQLEREREVHGHS